MGTVLQVAINASRLLGDILLNVIPAEWLGVAKRERVISLMAGTVHMTGTVVVGFLEGLRDSMLVAGISECTAVAARVLSRLELLFESAVLVVAEVVNLMGVLAVDDVATVAMVTVTMRLGASVEVSRRALLMVLTKSFKFLKITIAIMVPVVSMVGSMVTMGVVVALAGNSVMSRSVVVVGNVSALTMLSTGAIIVPVVAVVAVRLVMVLLKVRNVALVSVTVVRSVVNRVGIDFFEAGLLHSSNFVRVVVSMTMVTVRAMVARVAVVLVAIAMTGVMTMTGVVAMTSVMINVALVSNRVAVLGMAAMRSRVMALVLVAVLGVTVSRVALVAIAMVRVREVLSAKLLVVVTMALVAEVRSVVTVMGSVVTMVRSMGSVVAKGRAMVTVAVARMGNRVGIDFFEAGLLDASDMVRVVVSMTMMAVRAMVAVMTLMTVVTMVIAPLVMGVRIRQVVLNFSCRGNGSEASKGEGFKHFRISF